eukprot:4664526-Alexandrium_andersonii.AAC.1
MVFQMLPQRLHQMFHWLQMVFQVPPQRIQLKQWLRMVFQVLPQRSQLIQSLQLPWAPHHLSSAACHP